MAEIEHNKHVVAINEVERRMSQPITWTVEEEKQLVRKIDIFLMPTIWLMYLLSYMVCYPKTTICIDQALSSRC